MRNRGFTFIELMVTITIVAILTMMVLPAWRDNDRASIMAASQILISDIETAQVMTIAVPEDPICVRFDTSNNKYWLAPADDPDNPIVRTPSGDAYVVTFGEGRAVGAAGVSLAVSDCPDDTITFNSDGGLVDFTKAPTITLTIGEDAIYITVAPTTGTVIESNAAPGDDEALEPEV